VVFSTMGDGMAAVFASAREAVRAVLAAQQGLGAEPWGEVTGPLAARMGLLTGEGVLGGEQYLNQPLNRCARLMAAGHGGQVLVSGATEQLVRDDLPEGCALVDLGEHRLRDLARPGLSVAGSVVEFLRTRTALLLVLDNCGHLAAAAASLAADILRGCPGVRILATSQQPLGVGGEQVFGLRPLSLPPPDAGMAAAGARDAVSLFAQRAAAARGDFALTPANVAAVGEICRRLDGIPLAIELAAARVAAMRPAEITALLDERFRLLTRGRADASARQQTLQATLEWSYALLGQAEPRVFDGLGVFPGSFDAEAAVAVAGAAGLQRWDVLDALTSLVGKSLVAEEEGPGQTSRYRLLETMRAYARQQLAAGELGRLLDRHAEHYAAFAERAGPELVGPAQLEWQPRIRAERDNLQAAVTWALAEGGQARPLAFRIVTALAFFAATSPTIIRGWAEACLAQIGECPPELRATVLGAAAYGAFWPATFRWRSSRPRTPCKTREPAIRSSPGRCEVCSRRSAR
jgi:predicted ATPase